MHHPNYNILHHLMYQPIKYAHVPFLESSWSQLIEEGFKQRKEEAPSWLWSNSNKLFCCYTVSQTQDLCVSFLCFGRDSPFPYLHALDSWRPSCGAERERISHEITLACFSLCKVGWNRMSKEDPSMVKCFSFYTDEHWSEGPYTLGFPRQKQINTLQQIYRSLSTE